MGDFKIGEAVEWEVGTKTVKGYFRGEGTQPWSYSVRVLFIGEKPKTCILDVCKEHLKTCKIKL